MLGKARKKEQVSTLNTPGSISGEIDMTFLERVSALSGLKPKTLKIIGLAIIVVPVLIAGGLFVGYQLKQNRTVLSVGAYKINQRTYDKLVAQAADVGKNRGQARGAIIDSLASRAAADKLKVSYPTDDASLEDAASVMYKAPVDIKKQSGDEDDEKNSKPVVYNEFQRMTSYPLVIQPIIEVSEMGGYKAAVVEFPFSRYILGFFENKRSAAAGSQTSLIRNTDAIKQDMEYARKAAESYRQDYINKKKTIKEIVDEVSSNPRLVYGQSGNKSRLMLISNDGVVHDAAGTKGLFPGTFQVIKEVKSPGKPTELTEELFSGTYGVDIPEIKRSSDTVVAWYFAVIEQTIDKQEGIRQKYTDLTKEFSDV